MFLVVSFSEGLRKTNHLLNTKKDAHTVSFAVWFGSRPPEPWMGGGPNFGIRPPRKAQKENDAFFGPPTHAFFDPPSAEPDVLGLCV